MNTNAPIPTIETLRMGGRLVETKEGNRNGVRIGFVTGYMATWDIDSGGAFGMPDRFEPGAWAESLAEHRARGNRQVRLKDHHGQTVGGFPIEGVFEDSTGLFGTGEINLETQRGLEAFNLARQGVLTDFSVGFSVPAGGDDIQNGVRVITKARLWETSIVDEPANQHARILEVKNVTRFEDLPVLAAHQPVEPEQWGGAIASAYLFAGGPAIASVYKGKLCAIPAALLAAAEEVKSAEGLVPETRAAAIRHLERYFAKAGIESPFDAGDRQFYGAAEAKTMTRRDFEAALAKTGAFSKSAITTLAARLSEVAGAVGDAAMAEPEARYSLSSIAEDIHETLEALKG